MPGPPDVIRAERECHAKSCIRHAQAMGSGNPGDAVGVWDMAEEGAPLARARPCASLHQPDAVRCAYRGDARSYSAHGMRCSPDGMVRQLGGWQCVERLRKWRTMR